VARPPLHLAAVRPANASITEDRLGLRSAQRHAGHSATGPGSRPLTGSGQNRKAVYNETTGILTGILTGSFSAKVPVGRIEGEPRACLPARVALSNPAPVAEQVSQSEVQVRGLLRGREVVALTGRWLVLRVSCPDLSARVRDLRACT
jgi:hypothetical protein